MNKYLLLVFLALGSWFEAIAQLDVDAWNNFANSSFEKISSGEHDDATVIFDRQYVHTRSEGRKALSTVEVITTIHRKVKINSLYGLEKYNKLYIPTFTDLHQRLELIDCKAITHKENLPSVPADTNHFVSSTLPANTPFYYKKEGDVKMLAFRDVNIGDEIEYIYKIKRVYDIDPVFFYQTRSIDFSSSDYCLERSFFLSSELFEIELWPYNFDNGIDHKTDFSYESGLKIELKNIEPSSNELYGSHYIDEPRVVYSTSNYEGAEEITWSDFARDFKPKRRAASRSYIFDQEPIYQAQRQLDEIEDIRERYNMILDKINRPIEENFYNYDQVKDDIDVAWAYAQVISETCKVLDMPINFHFVESKSFGGLDTSYVSLYQFSNILCSFKDQSGEQVYFPLLEPYSSFNDIRCEYQGTNCLSIFQDERGKRTYRFDQIPSFDPGFYSKDIRITYDREQGDSLIYTINETVTLTGHSWLDMKAYISNALADSSTVEESMESLISNQMVLYDRVDSVYAIEYQTDDLSFEISYSYQIQRPKVASGIVSISPHFFIESSFYTPFHLRKVRKKNGYLHDIYNSRYKVTFVSENEFVWLENNLLKKEVQNNLGRIYRNYEQSGQEYTTILEITYSQDSFTPDEWPSIMDLRDAAYGFMSTNYYFKKK